MCEMNRRVIGEAHVSYFQKVVQILLYQDDSTRLESLKEVSSMW